MGKLTPLCFIFQILTSPIGFEYWANPSNPSEGYISWMVDGKQTTRMGATAVGPDQGTGGSGVGQRLIPEEPMVRPYVSYLTLSGLIDRSYPVHRAQLGNIAKLADYRFVHDAVPRIVSDRLRSCVPEERPDKHWLRPERLPNRGLYQSPSRFLHKCVLPCILAICADRHHCIDPNLTSWNYARPRNSLYDGC
jgi:hypothetical protein